MLTKNWQDDVQNGGALTEEVNQLFCLHHLKWWQIRASLVASSDVIVWDCTTFKIYKFLRYMARPQAYDLRWYSKGLIHRDGGDYRTYFVLGL
jgi:hypothetical protein